MFGSIGTLGLLPLSFKVVRFLQLLYIFEAVGFLFRHAALRAAIAGKLFNVRT